MTQLQQKLLNMMSVFHKICTEENLRYYLLGGTALGAARHGGFIPWDDDIDVGMPRSDYEKLKNIASSLNSDNYCFEFPSDKKDFVYAYGKMYDKQTTLIENTRYKTKRGIYLDIFPLDGAGDSHEAAIEQFRPIGKKNDLLSTVCCAWRRGRALYKNLAVVAMRFVPSFVLSAEKLRTELDELASKKDFDSCAYVANYFGNWREREISDKKWFGTPTLFKFEGIEVYGPEDYDAYLTSLYGDWRTPPPPEKQITHHDYLMIDLNTPYTK